MPPIPLDGAKIECLHDVGINGSRQFRASNRLGLSGPNHPTTLARDQRGAAVTWIGSLISQRPGVWRVFARQTRISTLPT